MKKPLLFTTFIFFTVVYVYAQDPTIKDLKNEATKSVKKDPADTAAKTWKLGGLVNVNINQGTLTNWSAGGDQFSFSLNALLNVFAFYKKNKS
ncbi:MAG TPA: DUF3078 domain-containing protein, partial [Ferruginibacter sp.]|nr:DUF3078 domain-containing protein [Ferruginibacter sp.]